MSYTTVIRIFYVNLYSEGQRYLFQTFPYCVHPPPVCYELA